MAQGVVQGGNSSNPTLGVPFLTLLEGLLELFIPFPLLLSGLPPSLNLLSHCLQLPLSLSLQLYLSGLLSFIFHFPSFLQLYHASFFLLISQFHLQLISYCLLLLFLNKSQQLLSLLLLSVSYRYLFLYLLLDRL